jgi:hypothetical protein
MEANISNANGSRIFGVSVRSWICAICIISGMFTLCYLAIISKEMEYVVYVVAILNALIGFLFGKSSGIVEAMSKK